MHRLVGLLAEVAARAAAVGRPALTDRIAGDHVLGPLLPVGGRSLRWSDVEAVATMIGDRSMVDAPEIVERHILDLATAVLPELERTPEMLDLAEAVRRALTRPRAEVSRLWKVPTDA